MRRCGAASGSSRRDSGPAFCAVVAGDDGRRTPNRLRTQTRPAVAGTARARGSCLARNGTAAALYRIRSAIVRVIISASSPMPNKVEDFRFRKKCVPMK